MMIHTTDIPTSQDAIDTLISTANRHENLSYLLELVQRTHTPGSFPHRFPKLSSDHGLLVSYGSQAQLIVPELATITWSPKRYHVQGEALVFEQLNAPFSHVKQDAYLRHEQLTTAREPIARTFEFTPWSGLSILSPYEAQRATRAAEIFLKR